MSLDIEYWQSRIPVGTDYGDENHINAMKAEIADLRAALGKANASADQWSATAATNWNATLASHQGVAVPAGWRLVPVAAPDVITVAIENEIDSQLYASGSSPADMVRQDGAEVWAAAIAAAPQPPAVKGADPRPLFDRKLADLEQRGYEVIGRILHKDGEYALFDSSCRWLSTPQYQRLMHEQDGSLFAQPGAGA